MKLKKDFKEFIELLNSANVSFVIVGGFAVAFHGHPRYTGDIDIFVERSEENSRRIWKAIERFGFAEIGLSQNDFTKPHRIIQLGFVPSRINIITGIDAVSFQEAWDDKADARLDGVPVAFISKEHLIINKAASGRPQDQADIARLADDPT